MQMREQWHWKNTPMYSKTQGTSQTVYKYALKTYIILETTILIPDKELTYTS